MATDTFIQFRNSLIQYYKAHNILVDTWQDGPILNSNILEIMTKPRKTLLYIKVSNIASPWWGLTPSQVNAISQANATWFVILLLSSPENGYILTSEQITKSIQNNDWSRNQRGQYNVHVPELSLSSRFTSFSNFVASIKR